jgi:hypothetical protein
MFLKKGLIDFNKLNVYGFTVAFINNQTYMWRSNVKSEISRTVVHRN